MKPEEIYHLKYPIGEFQKPKHITSTKIATWIDVIERFPNTILSATKGLTEQQLNYKYRPEGWTIKQVIHHCADSHINSILRFKLALTENTPTIRPYFEDRFARLKDYDEPIDTAISILEGTHKKLGIILKGLNQQELKKEYIHPEHCKRFSIEETIGIYAWHSNHHTAHIEQAIKSKGEYN